MTGIGAYECAFYGISYRFANAHYTMVQNMDYRLRNGRFAHSTNLNHYRLQKHTPVQRIILLSFVFAKLKHRFDGLKMSGIYQFTSDPYVGYWLG